MLPNALPVVPGSHCQSHSKALHSQDEALNELLPFGEYVPPERIASGVPSHFMVGLDSWELEQLLQRLAVAHGVGGISSRRDRRRHRAHSQASPAPPPRLSAGDT